MSSTVSRDYTDLRLAGSYNGLSGFLRNQKQYHDPKQVHNELMKLDSYALHLPVRRKFPRRKIITLFRNETLSADLKELGKLSRYNNGYRYILVVVDNFSRKLYTALLRKKTGAATLAGFKKIFKEIGSFPVYLFTDR